MKATHLIKHNNSKMFVFNLIWLTICIEGFMRLCEVNLRKIAVSLQASYPWLRISWNFLSLYRCFGCWSWSKILCSPVCHLHLCQILRMQPSPDNNHFFKPSKLKLRSERKFCWHFGPKNFGLMLRFTK